MLQIAKLLTFSIYPPKIQAIYVYYWPLIVFLLSLLGFLTVHTHRINTHENDCTLRVHSQRSDDHLPVEKDI